MRIFKWIFKSVLWIFVSVGTLIAVVFIFATAELLGQASSLPEQLVVAVMTVTINLLLTIAILYLVLNVLGVGSFLKRLRRRWLKRNEPVKDPFEAIDKYRQRD